jgi:hypothetical protein
MKVPVPFEYVFPAGCLFLGVEAATDFDKRGQGDDQVRDKDTGERVWLVKVLIWMRRPASSVAARKSRSR